MTFNEEKKYYVYVWFYKKDKKVFYVGKGTKYRYRSKKRDNPKLVEIINSFDCDSKIIEGNLSEKEAFDLEKEMIKYYKELGHPLINISEGGHMPPSHLGKKRTERTKEKMRKSIKKYHIDNPDIAKNQSKKMKEFLKTDEGKNFQRKSIESRRTENFRKKQSVICREANNKPEYIAKQSKIVKEMWESEEYRESHSGENNHRAQAVKQYDLNGNFIAEYVTMTEASKNTGVSVSKISSVARGVRKTAGGYTWEYVNDKKLKMKKTSFIYDVEKDKNAIPIIQYKKDGTFVSEYLSIADATRKNNYKNRTNIISNLKGKTKSAYGYVWKYKQDNTVPSLEEGHS